MMILLSRCAEGSERGDEEASKEQVAIIYRLEMRNIVSFDLSGRSMDLFVFMSR